MEHYDFNQRDCWVVGTTMQLLDKVIQSKLYTGAQLISLGKIKHFFDRIPYWTDDISVHMILSSPTRQFGDHRIMHWWDIDIQDAEIHISSGGYFERPETGGDSFTCMDWRITPNDESIYTDFIDDISRLADDAKSYDQEVHEMNIAQGGYSLDVSDESNLFLDKTVEGKCLGKSLDDFINNRARAGQCGRCSGPVADKDDPVFRGTGLCKTCQYEVIQELESMGVFDFLKNS
ncbi:MAG: hypothetical protein EOM20_02410 [Spartobacteria bacterium]|nr:hypothetical protein [Spartobacteria bacterium]